MTVSAGTCPNCGAEIAFRWSGAVQTVCPACKAILVRHDLNLEKVGQVGDVPPSMSRIQLGTTGRYEGKAFEVIGRIVYNYDRGHWSEWHIRLGDSSAWLSDAQGEYMVSHAVPTPPRLPQPAQIQLDDKLLVDGAYYSVTTITHASYAGVEGELPFTSWDRTQALFIDLKTAGEEFATLDFSETPPLAFVGEQVRFEALGLQNLRDADAASPGIGAPQTRSLSCPQCGSPIELRSGQLAQTVACSSCHAILDATDPNLALLQADDQKKRFIAKPLIPLGAVGQLKGEAWQVIGFQVREIEVDGIAYRWREYLLWNANEGFRYLTEYDGHWNDVRTAKGTPQPAGGQPPEMQYLGTKFKHFQSAKATTRFILGEFPWQVRRDDKVQGDDYVAPPLMLSRESTPDEVTWSVGTYTDPAVIQEAFKLEDRLPTPKGIFANQPNPNAGLSARRGRVFGVLAALLALLFIVRFTTARNQQVFEHRYSFAKETGDTGAFVTPVFELQGRTSNVELRIDAQLNNDWAYFNFALLPEAGGTGYDFGREVSFYYGVDDGEGWSEGSQNDRVLLPSIPPGRYYLRVEPEPDPQVTLVNYQLTVKRDVPRFWPFIVALALISIPPLFGWITESSFEQQRWAESDYAAGGDDDDDDDD